MTKEMQPEALRLAEFFESMKKSSHRWYDGTPVHEKAAAELRRLHARVEELEGQRKPLTDEQWLPVYGAWFSAPHADIEDFIRAIERAHGIGEVA